MKTSRGFLIGELLQGFCSLVNRFLRKALSHFQSYSHCKLVHAFQRPKRLTGSQKVVGSVPVRASETVFLRKLIRKTFTSHLYIHLALMCNTCEQNLQMTFHRTEIQRSSFWDPFFHSFSWIQCILHADDYGQMYKSPSFSVQSIVTIVLNTSTLIFANHGSETPNVWPTWNDYCIPLLTLAC